MNSIRLPVRLLFVLCFASCYLVSSGQASDYITVKKRNGRLIHMYVPGTRISFKTEYKNYVGGPIVKIKNDSIFIQMYDIRSFMTDFGFSRIDTIRTYIDGYPYRDIVSIEVFERSGFIRTNTPRLLFLGGAGYLVLNIFNSIYLKQSLTDKRNEKKLGIALISMASGFLVNKYGAANNFNRKEQRIEYIRMNK